MRGQRHILHARERVIRRERLGVEYIEPGVADMAAVERPDERCLVDQGAARGIDQDRARFHPRDAAGVDDAAGAVVEGEMQRDHVGPRQQGVELDQRHARVRARAAVPGDHLHADAARDPHHLAADAAEPDHAEHLSGELHAFERLPGAGAHRAVHARKAAAAGEHQRDRVLGDRGVAVALDGVHLDAQRVQRRHVHVARGAGAEEHDVLEALALRHEFGRHVGMVVDADIVSRQQLRQLATREWLGMDHDRRIVGPMHGGKNRLEVLVAVDEDGFHGVSNPGA